MSALLFCFACAVCLPLLVALAVAEDRRDAARRARRHR